MMSFTFYETALSVLSAFIYGLLFSFFSSLLSIVEYATHLVLTTKANIEVTPIKFDVLHQSILFKCTKIFLYGIGFMILSYIMLDGVLRTYMVLCSLIALFISKRIILNKITLYVCQKVHLIYVKFMDIVPTFLSKCKKLCISVTKKR